MNYKFLSVTVLAVTMAVFTSCEKDKDEDLFKNVNALYVSATRTANNQKIEIASLEADLAASKAESDSLLVDLSSALSNVASLTASVEGLEGDNAELMATLDVAKNYIVALQAREVQLVAKIADLVEALKKAVDQLDADLDVILSLQADLNEAIAMQTDLKDDLANANANIASLVAQVASLQGQLDDAGADAAQAEADAEQAIVDALQATWENSIASLLRIDIQDFFVGVEGESFTLTPELSFNQSSTPISGGGWGQASGFNLPTDVIITFYATGLDADGRSVRGEVLGTGLSFTGTFGSKRITSVEIVASSYSSNSVVVARVRLVVN